MAVRIIKHLQETSMKAALSAIENLARYFSCQRCAIHALAVLLASLTMAVLPTPGAAQTYPDKPVKILVYAAAGGSSDTTARVVAERLSKKWGQSVVVENKLGANGMIATQALLASPPDGYTLMLGSVGQMALNPLQYGKKYDPNSAFTLVAQLTDTFMVMVAAPSQPFNNLREYIAYAKEHPKTLSYTSSGVGSLNHIASESIRQIADVEVVHVAYKGESQAVTDLLTGRVSSGFVVASTGIPMVRSGKLKALAVPEKTRPQTLPNVPTTVEQGVDVTMPVWNGIIAPPGMSAALVQQLNRDINQVLSDEAVKARLADMGMTATPRTPVQFSEMVRGEVRKWGDYVARTGITFQ
jgi:tripartite-type tricarboxylate transporter receptor subunit TctC